MDGSIATRQKCSICGGNFYHNEKRSGLFCKNHPQISANRFIVRFPPAIFLNFKTYEEAAQQLNGLRYKKVENTFDPADYRKDKPNNFRSLSIKYLNTKIKRKSYRDIERGIKQPCKYFKDINVKDITGAALEDYLFSIPNISEKTRYNKRSHLQDFWKWLLRRGVINLSQMPLFPEITYELGYRTIIDWETQEAIIKEVYTIAKNEKVGFGIELLATYPALRPGDLLKIRESDIDLLHHEIIIKDPTKTRNKFKQILLLEEHAHKFKILKDQYPGFPSLPFFRHIAGISGTKADKPFGHKLFYKWWKKACSNLGIEGVDLYGGTRHSTTTEIARRKGEHYAIKATGHETNKAFRRYCQVQDNVALEMARLTLDERKKKPAQILELKKYVNK